MLSIESKWDYFRGESIGQVAYREQTGVDGGANFGGGVDPPRGRGSMQSWQTGGELILQ